MATEVIDRFVLHGREFLVLHKPSACYLRADGRMWASLGGGLEPDDAINLARMQAELMVLQERHQETTLVHRLWERPLAPEVANFAGDYVCQTLRLALPDASGAEVEADVVYAPFNHNAYICTPQAWRWIGAFPSAQEAWDSIPNWLKAENTSASTDARRRSPSPTSALASWLSKWKVEVAVWDAVMLLVVLAFVLAFVLHWAINRWPVLLVVLCGLVFVGAGVGVWLQRREQQRQKAKEVESETRD